MTSPQNLGQRVGRNTNDIDAIYDLLEETDVKVSIIDAKVETIDAKVGRIEATQQVHGEKLDTLLDLLGNERRSGDT